MLNKIPVMETKHYILRGAALEDAEALFQFLSDPDTMKFITPHPVKTVQEVRESIASMIEKFVQMKNISWVIVDKVSLAVTGSFRLHKLYMDYQKTEMGIVIRKDFQRKGVMTEVLGVVLPYCFEELKLNRVAGDIFAENIGSQKLP